MCHLDFILYFSLFRRTEVNDRFTLDALKECFVFSLVHCFRQEQDACMHLKSIRDKHFQTEEDIYHPTGIYL